MGKFSGGENFGRLTGAPGTDLEVPQNLQVLSPRARRLRSKQIGLRRFPILPPHYAWVCRHRRPFFFLPKQKPQSQSPVHGRRFTLQHRTKTTARCGEWATAKKGAGRRGKGGKWETATGASGTALSLDPCEPWPFRLDTGRPLCEGIVPPQGECIPMCWGGDGPVSALLSTGNGTRQHIKMGHTLSRISTVAHLHLTNPSLLSV